MAAADAPPSPPPVDPALAPLCDFVRTLIDGVGEDANREGLVDTPKVRRWREREAGAGRGGAPRGKRDSGGGRSTFSHKKITRPRLPLSLLPSFQRVAKAWLDMTAGYKADIDRCGEAGARAREGGARPLGDAPLSLVCLGPARAGGRETAGGQGGGGEGPPPIRALLRLAAARPAPAPAARGPASHGHSGHAPAVWRRPRRRASAGN